MGQAERGWLHVGEKLYGWFIEDCGTGAFPGVIGGDYRCGAEDTISILLHEHGISSEGVARRVDTSMMTLQQFAHKLDAIPATTV
jgi:hypothetical protein